MLNSHYINFKANLTDWWS